MSAKFEPIRILDLDVDKTQPSRTASGLRLMHLKLSAHPTAEWAQLFKNQRQFPRHSMWREAWIEGRDIVVDCVPEEIKQYHLRDLKEDVGAVNNAYQNYLNRVAADQERIAKEQQAERERLEAVKAGLTFN
ncbi:MAG: hypothetical protein ACREGC_01690 [Minisyncoccia bacterium]